MAASHLKLHKLRHQLTGERGQAAVEMAFALPFLIWLIYYTINAFHTIHTSHIAQKYAAMNLYQRLSNRSKFEVDEVAQKLHNKGYMAVRYTDPNGEAPKRKILLQTNNPPQALNVVGVCKEPGCN